MLGRTRIGPVLAERIRILLARHLKVLVELACRGIQLPNERDARIETADLLQARNIQFEKQGTAKDVQIATLNRDCEHLAARAERAEEELARISADQDRRERDDLKLRPLASLSKIAALRMCPDVLTALPSWADEPPFNASLFPRS